MDTNVVESSPVQLKRTENRNLPVRLTELELRDRGDALAAVIQDLKAEEDRQVDTKAHMKARLSELDAKKTQLAIVICRREEPRDVQVDVFFDYSRQIVESVRRDTGECIHTRRMDEHEKQMPLPA
jgi:hypothetical protein